MEPEAAPHRTNAAHPTPPSLTTDRFVLRPLHANDVDALLDLSSRPEVMQWIGDGRVLSARARLGMTHGGPTDRYHDVTTELFDLEMTR